MIAITPGSMSLDDGPRSRPGLHVQNRPAPGLTVVPAETGPDQAGLAHALAAARGALASGIQPCGPECPVCSSGWTFHDRAVGDCVACGEPCRSTDPDGLRRHPTCEIGDA